MTSMQSRAVVVRYDSETNAEAARRMKLSPHAIGQRLREAKAKMSAPELARFLCATRKNRTARVVQLSAFQEN